MAEKTFHVRVAVESVRGHQVFKIDAASEKEAIRKVRTEGGVWVEDEIEVTNLDWNDVIAEEQPEEQTNESKPAVE